MRYRYLDDFRRGISVFAIFSYGIAVLGTPQCPPPNGACFRRLVQRTYVIMYEFCFTCFKVECKRPYIFQSSSNETIIEI